MATSRLQTLSAALAIAALNVGCGNQSNHAPSPAHGGAGGSGGTMRSGGGGSPSGVGGTGGRSTSVATGGQSGTGVAAGGTSTASQGGASTGGVTGSAGAGGGSSASGGRSALGTGGASGGASGSGGRAMGGTTGGGSGGSFGNGGSSGVRDAAVETPAADAGLADAPAKDSATGIATTITIKPGGTWNDTSGTPIQAHGGGFLKVDDTWYWVGEDKTTDTGGSGFFYAVSIYASKDLSTWEHRNKIITTATDPLLASDRIIERPKIIYNDKTKMYVMWAHWDNTAYTDSNAGIFKSPTIDGNYTYVSHIKPGGHDTRDCTLFKEDDGTAYFIAVGNNNSDLWVYPLSDDYLSVKSGSNGTDIFPSQWREAPAIVKINGTYYLITSWSSGWNPNQGAYSTATSITGPWAALKNIGDDTTYQSQSTYIITVKGSQSTTYIFAGDRWNSGNLSKSQYVWWPLTINGTTMSMTNYKQWSLNLGTGVWSAN
jgi:hypothetical protein